MKRLAIFASFVFLIFSNIAMAENSKEFEFAEDFIDSLGYVKNGIEKMEMADPANTEYKNDVAMGIGFMKSVRLATSDLEMAKSLMEQYVNSTNELIKEAAKGAVISYDLQIQTNDKGLKLYEKLYSPEVVNNPAEFNQGKHMSEMSKLEADKDQELKLLMNCTVMLTYALASNVPDEEGKMSYLAITQQERQRLIEQIDSTFGNKAKGELKVGMSYMDACGTTIRTFLMQPYKTADQR